MTPTLFIGGLSYDSTVDSIKEYFSSAGEVVRARIVSDKETGKVISFLFSLEDLDMSNFLILVLLKKHMILSMEDN